MYVNSEARLRVVSGVTRALVIAAALLAAFSAVSEGRRGAETPAEAFSRGNAVAMDRMMAGMSAPSSGNIDIDFVDMMEPHHQGAIDMAMLQLRYGKNEKLHRIAQEIIVSQRQEIDAMRLAIGRPLTLREPFPTQISPKPSTTGPHDHSEPKP